MKSNNNSSRRLFLAIMLLLVLILGYLFPNLGLKGVEAVGNSPSTCPNRYDSDFTSFAIDTGMQKIDAMANPGATFRALTNEGYNVSFVMHTAGTSYLRNTRKGTTWYNDNAYGNSLGVCIGQEGDGKLTVGPNENVPVNLHVSMDPTYDPSAYGGKQQVIWQDLPSLTGPYYNVVWVEQTSLILSCYTQNQLITCSSKVAGLYGPPSSAFGTPTGNVNFTIGSLAVGSCTLQVSASYSSCLLSFAPPIDGSITITASYGGDSLHAPSSNITTIACCPLPSTSSSTSSPTTTSISSDSSSLVTSYTSSASTVRTSSNPLDTGTTYPLPPSLGHAGIGFTESVMALIVSAVVIAGILGFAIRKLW